MDNSILFADAKGLKQKFSKKKQPVSKYECDEVDGADREAQKIREKIVTSWQV